MMTENNFVKYSVIRSRRKTIAVEINSDGTVIVRAPLNITDAYIEEFVKERKTWIEEHLEKVIEKNKRLGDVKKLSVQEVERLKKLAKSVIPTKVAYYSRLLGIKYNNITIRAQKSRWGSCSSKKNLNFNCLLMLTPDKVTDYVVIHELCHIKQMNHSGKFWDLVELAMPDYKIYKKWLSENGNILIYSLPDKEGNDKHYAYMLRCADNSFYIGYTNNLENRIKMHSSGRGAKYTRARLPIELIYYEEYDSKTEAMSREASLKSLNRRQKINLLDDKKNALLAKGIAHIP